MIVSLNLPDDLIAFIDGKATDAKLSRSAWMTGALRNMQLIDSAAGRKGLAHLVMGLMADGALRSGQPIEHVRKLFPDFERPLALDQPTTPQLPAAAFPAPSARQSVTVTRRRPYQRGGARVVRFTCPTDRQG